MDLDAVREALPHVVGEHDFTSFRGQGCAARTAVRTIFRAELAPVGFASLLAIDVAGSGFLRHMVRNVVGTLVDIGRGKFPPERMGEIISARDRSRAGPTAPAHGLFLWEVRY